MFREPTVKVRSITIDERPDMARMGTVPIFISVEIDNPNSFSIKSKSLIYTVTWKEEKLAGGEIREEVEIPGNTKKAIQVPVRISLEPLARALKITLESLEVSLTAFGSVTLDTIAGDITIPFRKNFSKNLRELTGQ